MSERYHGNEYRTTAVCIDAYDGKVLKGRLYNPVNRDGERFSSTMEFLQKMDRMLDAMSFPQSFTVTRSFGAAPPVQVQSDPSREPQTGAAATFALRVIFRQNSSWQGSLVWMEGKAEQSFRSALELLYLMDDALEKKKD